MNSSLYQQYGAPMDQATMQRLNQDEERRRQDAQLAGSLASLPNTELGYEWLGADMPAGQMISGRYVAPSMTQNLAAMVQKGLGGMMVKRRGDQAKALAQALAGRYGAGGPAANANVMNGMDSDPLGI